MGLDWKKLLAGAAPMLGTALGGPLGGAAASALVGKLGLSTKDGKPVDPNNQSDFEAAMSDALLKPEQIVAIKQSEMEFKQNMAELGIKSTQDLEKIAADDRASAREREIQVKDWMPRLLGTGIVAAFVAAVFMILTGHSKAESVIAGTLLGYLSAKSEFVFNYYFGSSASSDRKTELLAQAPAIDAK